ncbi:MAG: hypothetical protein IPL54_08870 [Chitinophagaceae bacterium]|nr:hypothetical protein [Chitinophagaceae bacterium]
MCLVLNIRDLLKVKVVITEDDVLKDFYTKEILINLTSPISSGGNRKTVNMTVKYK